MRKKCPITTIFEFMPPLPTRIRVRIVTYYYMKHPRSDIINKTSSNLCAIEDLEPFPFSKSLPKIVLVYISERYALCAKELTICL